MNKKKKEWLISYSMVTIFVSVIFCAFHPLVGLIVFLGFLYNVKNWYELSR